MNSIFCFRNRTSAGALLLALIFSTTVGQSKLSVPPGSDPDTEAKVDAFNEALDGPDDGQSTESWQREFKAAHDALYPDNPLDISDDGFGSSPGGGSSEGGTDTPKVTTVDLCQSKLDDWLLPGRDEASGGAISTQLASKEVSSTLGNAAAKQDIETALENLTYFMMLVESPTSFVPYIARPIVSDVSCTDGTSHFSAAVPVTVHKLGLTLDHGSVVLHGSASYRSGPGLPEWEPDGEWCVNVQSYDIRGLEPLTQALIQPALTEILGSVMSMRSFCLSAPVLPPWGT